MASGRLGVFPIPATQATTVYTVPPGYYTIANISIVNRGAAAINLRLAMTTSGGATPVPNVEEWIEYVFKIKGSIM